MAYVTVIVMLCFSVAMGLKLEIVTGKPGYTAARFVPQLAGFIGLGVAVRLIGDMPIWAVLLLPILTTVLPRHFGGLVEQSTEGFIRLQIGPANPFRLDALVDDDA